MAKDNQLTVAGNAGGDAELRVTQGGSSVGNFSLAWTKRIRDAQGNWSDGPVTWFRVSAWDKLGEHVAEAVKKGMRVQVTGTLEQRQYQKDDGTTGYSLDLTADEVALSLRFSNPITGESAYNGGGGQRQSAPAASTSGGGGWGGSDVPPPDDVPF